jgi:hypothetical protein
VGLIVVIFYTGGDVSAIVPSKTAFWLKKYLTDTLNAPRAMRTISYLNNKYVYAYVYGRGRFSA